MSSKYDSTSRPQDYLVSQEDYGDRSQQLHDNKGLDKVYADGPKETTGYDNAEPASKQVIGGDYLLNKMASQKDEKQKAQQIQNIKVRQSKNKTSDAESEAMNSRKWTGKIT